MTLSQNIPIFKKKFNQGCMLIMGGAKSGKSTFALEICNRLNMKRVFLATAQAGDKEMVERIERHQAERGDRWNTVEEPLFLAEKVRELDEKDSVILVDCMTLWLSNMFMEFDPDTRSIYQAIDELTEQLVNTSGAIVMVSNEVGMSIVPENPLARKYRDVAGIVNQRIASLSRKVVVIFGGLPLVLKDD